SELFTTVRRSIWSELGGKGSVDVTMQRRQLQRAHVTQLMALVGDESAPTDAAALARADLGAIARAVKAARARPADAAVKAHLAQLDNLVSLFSYDDAPPAPKIPAPGVAKK
ncbi:MAG: hypothetical protein ACHQ49_18545, partial [Elusimicrobiota bacterium]